MTTLKLHTKNIRRTIIEESYKKQLGHVGSCLSAVEIMTALFFKIMKPEDIFILSPGHKALALYATLKEKGIIKKIDMEKLGGHPNRNPKIGIYVSTGSLGHGLSLGIGFAIANPKRKVYVLLSDGDLEEGSTREAMEFVNLHNVENLIAYVDCNGWSAYKEAEHNIHTEDYPWMNFEYTIKGKGLPEIENTLKSHYVKVTKEMVSKYAKRI